jgi:hypothetical protein
MEVATRGSQEKISTIEDGFDTFVRPAYRGAEFCFRKTGYNGLAVGADDFETFLDKLDLIDSTCRILSDFE